MRFAYIRKNTLQTDLHLKVEDSLTNSFVYNSERKLMTKIKEPHINLVNSSEFQNHKIRAVYNTIYPRPPSETFHEFIILLLNTSFGGEWHDYQNKQPNKDQHVLNIWNREFKDFIIANGSPENKTSDGTWELRPNGYVQALLSLAYDFYIVKCLNHVSDTLLKRLRNYDQFQGARYELGVMAIVARAGFSIDPLDNKEKGKKHCEFIAINKYSNLKIAFEAKSRHRKGAIHEDGSFNMESDYKADVENLIYKACNQKPADLPFIIFVDLNLPLSGKNQWLQDIIKRLK